MLYSEGADDAKIGRPGPSFVLRDGPCQFRQGRSGIVRSVQKKAYFPVLMVGILVRRRSD